jgi:hypothetical protein
MQLTNYLNTGKISIVNFELETNLIIYSIYGLNNEEIEFISNYGA